MKHFLQYWKNYSSSAELGTPLLFSASNQFPKRNVSKGDSLWLVTLIEGRLTLLGHFQIDSVIGQAEAQRLLGPSIYLASTYAIPARGEERPIVEVDIQHHADHLRFLGNSVKLSFHDPEITDGKQLQSLRQLTDESVRLLSLSLGIQAADSEGVRSTAKRRNPSWSRDELILALDLYFKHNPATISQNHPSVTELSATLNSLGMRLRRIENGKFRNDNGVYMKLCNFLRFDPSYTGSGLTRGGKLEEEVWSEYSQNKNQLVAIARGIVAELTDETSWVSDEIADPDETEFSEGSLLFRAHLRRERNRKLVKRAKELAKRKSPDLLCEICGFSFVCVYGPLGENYIECHHTVPVSSMKPGDKTKLSDIALLCSNCHRMVHRRKKWLSLQELRTILAAQTESRPVPRHTRARTTC